MFAGGEALALTVEAARVVFQGARAGVRVGHQLLFQLAVLRVVDVGCQQHRRVVRVAQHLRRNEPHFFKRMSALVG